MVGKKSGKGRRKKKGVSNTTAQEKSSGGAKDKSQLEDSSSSDSSDDDLDFVEDNFSIDSKGKKKVRTQKKGKEHDAVQPSDFDLTGLPDPSSHTPLKHYTRGSSTTPEDQGKNKTDQDAEDTAHYDLSQVEVINVNAEDPTTDEGVLQRRRLGKIIWDKYGEKVPIYDGTADFLLYVIDGYPDSPAKAAKGPTY